MLALRAVDLSLAYAPRLLVLGDGPVGTRVIQHADAKGLRVMRHPDDDVDLVLGCQFEFGLDELRRSQDILRPRLATLISPLNSGERFKVAAAYNQRVFQKFSCPVWIMFSPALSEINQTHLRTPTAVAHEALDTSLRMLDIN